MPLTPTPDPAPHSATRRLVESHANFMVRTYARPPPVFARGKGTWLYDVDGRAYLDLTGGVAVNALGHCDSGVAAVLAEQAQTLMHTSNLYHNTLAGRLSRELVERTRASGGMPAASCAFLCNSGTEANEAALKFARKVGVMRSKSAEKSKKHKVLAFSGAFHGRTMFALSATPSPKYQTPFAPVVPGVEIAPYDDTAAAMDVLNDDFCGVIVEPIQGEGGVHVPSASFLAALRRRCDDVGAVLIFDEIQCGLGRTGKLWAHAHYSPDAGVTPDILTTAKALGNGFPVGATLVNDAVAGCIALGDHGTTFGGNPLAARVASYMLARLSDPALLAAVANKERLFREMLDALRAQFPQHIGETRGKGLLLGLQLRCDPQPVVDAARQRGLLIITAGGGTLRFVPALTISEEEIKEGIRVLGEAFGDVFQEHREG